VVLPTLAPLQLDRSIHHIRSYSQDPVYANVVLKLTITSDNTVLEELLLVLWMD
jgi:hypothetical protein